jgi:eukaryotic-like serine/threonine-protein kinase
LSLKPGDIIENKYRIVRLLGEGGMGAVFEGENTRIKRRVAIKVLHAAIAHDAGVARRFQQEAQAAGHIGNEHIIEVLDLGELSNGDHFMVMEYLDGETLTDRIKRLGRLSPEQALPLFRQILEGLGAAHDAGILHRDLKPDNIFILHEKAGQKDFVKIIDFGISKFAPLAGEMKMTRTGTLMGTPYYMSPEQASGAREMNTQSDIYAVGVILYEALTGAVPFDAPTFNQLMFRIVLSEACPIERLAPDLNPAFASIVKKAMAREQTHRFESCREVIGALDAWARTGAGVEVPPAAAGDTYLPDGAGSLPDATARQSVEFAATGLAQLPEFTRTAGALSKTNQAWANTNATTTALSAPEQKKSKTPLAIAAVAGALLLGGGGVLFAKLTGNTHAPIAAVAGDAPVAAAAPPPLVIPEPPKPAEPVALAGAQLAPAPASTAAAVPTEEVIAVEEKPNTAPAQSTAPAGAVAPPVKQAKRPTPRATAPAKNKRRDFGY